VKTLNELKYDKSEIERKMKEVKKKYQKGIIDKYGYDDLYLPLVSEFRKVEKDIEKEKERLKQVEESKRKVNNQMKGKQKDKKSWWD